MFRHACLLLFLFLALILGTDGFASRLDCRHLLEEDEIIMNNKVTNVPAYGPIIKLAVYDTSGYRVDIPSEEDAKSIVWINPSDSPPTLTFTIGIDPEIAAGISDLQYVVETSPFGESIVESTFIDASTGGGLLCNGRRGYARGKTGTVKYMLRTMGDDDILAEIVAGYSAYHGPVTLTPRIMFKRRGMRSETDLATTMDL